ncbi:hypothetical protein ACFYXM_11630 [Streptomyces sp. NPDC002476]|uniref:hypothetical protein n=1 Tax=Streptomyces sp. NPDC002476 TaxID=3364648 RepID=UPI00368266DF
MSPRGGGILHPDRRLPGYTDYDLYALVVYANGRVETVATFPAEGVPAQLATADVAEEIIEMALNDSIRAVIPVAYSAQSNGNGSLLCTSRTCWPGRTRR